MVSEPHPLTLTARKRLALAQEVQQEPQRGMPPPAHGKDPLARLTPALARMVNQLLRVELLRRHTARQTAMSIANRVTQDSILRVVCLPLALAM